MYLKVLSRLYSTLDLKVTFLTSLYIRPIALTVKHLLELEEQESTATVTHPKVLLSILSNLNIYWESSSGL